MQLSELQQHIDECLNGLRSLYSEKWIDLLRWMLRVEEVHRPNSLQLQIGIDNSFRYYDDEYLDFPTFATNIKDNLQLSIKSGLMSVHVTLTSVDTAPCMVTIETTKQNPSQRA